MEKKTYYFVEGDEGRFFFESGDKLLEFLRNNDATQAGAEELTDDQWAKIQSAKDGETVEYANV